HGAGSVSEQYYAGESSPQVWCLLFEIWCETVRGNIEQIYIGTDSYHNLSASRQSHGAENAPLYATTTISATTMATPPALVWRMNRYHCVHCGMFHLAICDLLEPIVDDSSLSLNDMAYRRCLECKEVASTTDGDEGGGGKGKRKKIRKSAVDIAAPTRQTVADCRAQNTVLHRGLP
ncbi:unnamed protein product, partial [Sphacelaria rigidula]